MATRALTASGKAIGRAGLLPSLRLPAVCAARSRPSARPISSATLASSQELRLNKWSNCHEMV
jgi:hypothetical protein